MERPVKERLVGAAVLMAAAIILIPEMLSGPDRSSTEVKPAEAGEGVIKTYTIDLSQSPGASTPSAASAPDNRSPPPEEVSSTSASTPVRQAAPEIAPAPEPTQPRVAAAPTPDESAKAQPSPPKPQPERQIAAQPARAEAPPQTPPQPKSETRQAEATPSPASKPPAQPSTQATQAKAESPPKPVASAPSAPTPGKSTAVPTGKGWAVQLVVYSSEATAERLANEWRGKGQNAFVMPVTSGGKTLYRVRIGPSKDRAGAEATLKVVKASIPSAAVVAHP